MQNGLIELNRLKLGLMYRPVGTSSLTFTIFMLISGRRLQYAAENTNMNQHVSHKKAILRKKKLFKRTKILNYSQ